MTVFLAEPRRSAQPSSLRILSAATVAATILLIVGGGVVRMSGSGLGCPDWPTCAGGALAPTAIADGHALIEFANRLLAGVLGLLVLWLAIAARQVPGVARWAWVQLGIVALNALVGGVSVWVKLNPYVVGAHFLAAMLLLAVAVITWSRIPAGDGAHTGRAERAVVGEEDPDRRWARGAAMRARRWANRLVVATALVVVVGSLVSGAGPHAGASTEVSRIDISWGVALGVHSSMGTIVAVIAVGLWWAARRAHERPRQRRTAVFLGLLVLQGALGVLQSQTQLPEAMVVLHLFGAALLWAGALRLRCE